MNTLASSLVSLKLRLASHGLLARTIRELSNAPEGLAPFVEHKNKRDFSVWRDSEGLMRVQVASTFATEAKGVELSFPIIFSFPLADAFTGRKLSEAFRAGWATTVRSALDLELSRGWEYELGRNVATPYLKAYETICFDPASDDVVRAYIRDERSGEETRYAYVNFEALDLDEATNTAGALVFDGAPISTANLIDYVALAAASNMATADAWLAEQPQEVGNRFRRMMPQSYIDVNGDPDAGAIRAAHAQSVFTLA